MNADRNPSTNPSRSCPVATRRRGKVAGTTLAAALGVVLLAIPALSVVAQDDPEAATLILKPTAPATPPEVQALADDHAVHVERIEQLRRGGRLLLIHLHSGADPTEAMQDLGDDPRVKRVSRNLPMTLDGITDDPRLPQQWGLDNGGIDIGFAAVYAPASGDDPVLVAVLDTGVDLDHPDLEDRLVDGIDLVDHDGLPDDTDGHGTLVASIIAAATDNAIGMAGVCADCKVLPVRISAGSRFDEAALIAGIDEVIHHEPRVRVINISSGLEPGAHSIHLHEAVQDAVAAGITVIAASGNDGIDLLREPAAYAETIAVGAIDPGGTLAGFSNAGEPLDLSAPGVDILAAYPPELGGDGYVRADGTSFSAPFATGVVGLMLAAEPDLAPETIRNRLAAAAQDRVGVPEQDGPGWDPGHGWGLLDADAALHALPPLAAPAEPTLIAADENPTGRIRLSWIEEPDATDYRVYRGSGPDGEMALVGHAAGGDGFIDRLLPAQGGEVWYRLAAANGAGESPRSWPIAGPLVCPAPILSGLANGSLHAGVRLHWQPVEGATGYRVYRSRNQHEIGDTIAEVDVGTYDDRLPGDWSDYYYRIGALVPGCIENPSRPIPASHGGYIGAPAGVSASENGFGWIEIRWDPVPGANGYRLYRAESPDGPWTLRHHILDDPFVWSPGERPIETRFMDLSAPEGRSFYRVKALRSVGSTGYHSGPFSAVVSGWSRPLWQLHPIEIERPLPTLIQPPPRIEVPKPIEIHQPLRIEIPKPIEILRPMRIEVPRLIEILTPVRIDVPTPIEIIKPVRIDVLKPIEILRPVRIDLPPVLRLP